VSVSLVIDEHREYLGDRSRVSAFARAIGEVVRPGDVVLDLGAGTGLLGLLACRAGAARVYSIDEGSIIEVARELAKTNAFAERMVFIKGLSTRIDLPEKADVVVADQIGRFGFEAGMFEYFRDARGRLLKPEGCSIPSRITFYAAPVERPDLSAQIEFWHTAPAELDFRPVRNLAANTGYPARLQPEDLLGEPASLGSLDPATADPGPWSLEASVLATRPGLLHGIGGWFVARLSDGVSMSNGPLAAERINRRNVFFPIDRPTPLERGDRVRIAFRIFPSQLLVAWTVEVTGAGDGALKARFRHSTVQGMLLAQEDLRRTRPGFVPMLSPWGRARRSILELCDGRRAVTEIEREVYRRHPELFRSDGEAAAFVAEVITRYST
jgi:protein arginine N-methyltransferase 1